MTWSYLDTELLGTPEGYVGFVYLITRLRDGKAYIGKKGFHSQITKPPLKGKTRKRRSKKESDWQKYFGSNAELKEDVLKEGPEGFRREVLYLCKTKSEMSYYEAYEQFVRHVLRDPMYYNAWISVKVTRSHLGSE